MVRPRAPGNPTDLRETKSAVAPLVMSSVEIGEIFSYIMTSMIIAIKRPVVAAKRNWPKLTAEQFQQVFNEQAKLAYGPVMIAATGSFSDPLFATVFQPQNPIPLIEAVAAPSHAGRCNGGAVGQHGGKHRTLERGIVILIGAGVERPVGQREHATRGGNMRRRDTSGRAADHATVVSSR
jgi:hypothetical protein